MAKITFLGTASAVPNKNHQNTHFVVESDKNTILVDCVGNPVVRLEETEINPLSITDLILTHFHPDHVSGVPLLLMDMWLMGREKALNIYGLNVVIDRIKQMMALFDWQEWLGFYPVKFHGLSDGEGMTLIKDENVSIVASNVAHMIPGMGCRMTFPDGTLCYSSDTAPCDAVKRLAAGADILIHEATGQGEGHSSPEEAGEIARQAGVSKLILIHYPPISDQSELAERARENFQGEVIVAEDLMTVTL